MGGGEDDLVVTDDLDFGEGVHSLHGVFLLLGVVGFNGSVVSVCIVI